MVIRTMAAAKKKPDLKEEGVTYYYAPGGTSFKAPKVDVDGIYKILENKTIEEGVTKQQRILFQNDPKFSVMNLEKKEIDEDLTTHLEDIAETLALGTFIQRAWRDTAEWGPALTNPVWDYEGSEFRPLKLKRLPPESFGKTGVSFSNIKNRILPGIMLNEQTQQVEYWQADSYGLPHKLTNVEMLTDPIRSQLGGSPAIVPIFPYAKMMTYSWMRQMQKVSQYGSGGIWFLKVTDPTGEDKEYAQRILNNTSSVNRYQLRPNMEIENLGINESGSALETITQLGMEIRQFFTPAGLVQKDGTLIGGSSDPEFQLYMSFISGTHRWLEAYLRKLLNPWLVYNGYYDKGYRIIVDIPAPSVDRSELFLKVHDSGSEQGTLLPNEKRALLRAALPQQAGIDISDLDPKGLAELEAYNARIKPGAQLQKIDAIARAVDANKLDPSYLLGREGVKKARKLVQATLGIEEGAS